MEAINKNILAEFGFQFHDVMREESEKGKFYCHTIMFQHNEIKTLFVDVGYFYDCIHVAVYSSAYGGGYYFFDEFGKAERKYEHIAETMGGITEEIAKKINVHVRRNLFA